MDVGILLNLIDDLLREERNQKLNDKLSKLADLIKDLIANPAKDLADIDKLTDEIKNLIDKSIAFEFTPSVIKVFETINGDQYFGRGFKKRVEEVFLNKFVLSTAIENLKKLQVERKEFIERIDAIQGNAELLGLKPYYHTDEVYEIGVLIPDKENLSKVNVIEKQLHNWDFVLKNLSEITGLPVEDTKIHRVSKGCIEIFFQKAFEIADCIALIITKVSVIYLTIREIKKHRDGLKKLNVPALETKVIEEHEKSLIESTIQETTDEILKKYGKSADQNRKNELRTGLTKGIKFIARSIDNGIEIEIIPPYIGNDEDEAATIKEDEPAETRKLKQQKALAKKKKEERIEIIKKSANVLKDISEAGSGVLKLLQGGDDKIENQKREA